MRVLTAEHRLLMLLGVRLLLGCFGMRSRKKKCYLLFVKWPILDGNVHQYFVFLHFRRFPAFIKLLWNQYIDFLRSNSALFLQIKLKYLEQCQHLFHFVGIFELFTNYTSFLLQLLYVKQQKGNPATLKEILIWFNCGILRKKQNFAKTKSVFLTWKLSICYDKTKINVALLF